MENIAHTLCGLRIADLGGPAGGWRSRVGPKAPVIAAIAANLPDADLVLMLGGRDLYTWWHRGITHSVAGWPLLALAGAQITRRWTGQGTYRDHAALWGWGLLSHVLLDWPTSWGTMLFLPLTDTRFSLDWIFIVDPVFWLCLGGLPWLLRRRATTRDPDSVRQDSARTGLLALAGWVLICGAMQQQAGTQAPRGTDVFPAPLAPARWTGTHAHDEVVDRWLLTPASGAQAGSWSALTPAEETALRGLHAADRWLWKAKSPVVVRREDAAEGTVLTLADAAYASWMSGDVGAARFGAVFTLRTDGVVVRGDARTAGAGAE